MNIGAFNISVSEVADLLKFSSLFREKGVKPLGEVSDEFKNTSIKGTYFDSYKTAIKNLDFDFLLKDESFFQFTHKPTDETKLPFLRYAFFQNPRDILTYEEYIEEELSSSYEEIGDTFIEEYGQYVTEAELNSNSIMIRYDLDYKGYRPLIHATSHLHIGNSENIRIPCNKVMTPLSFTIFVIKHVYYNNWKNLIDDFETFNKRYFDLTKKQCAFVSPVYWQTPIESKEFFLS